MTKSAWPVHKPAAKVRYCMIYLTGDVGLVNGSLQRRTPVEMFMSRRGDYEKANHEHRASAHTLMKGSAALCYTH